MVKCYFCKSNTVIIGKLAHKKNCPLFMGRVNFKEHVIDGEKYKTTNTKNTEVSNGD